MKTSMRIVASIVLLQAGFAGATVVTLGPDDNMTTSNWSQGPDAKSGNVTIVSPWALSNVADADLGDALNMGSTFNFTSSGASKWIANTAFRSDWTYNPSVSGAITNIAFTGDFTANYGVNVRVAVQQGGNTFWLTSAAEGMAVVLNTGVTSVSYASMVAADFSVFGTSTGTLDLSATGGEITFGYAARYGSTAAFNNRALALHADNVSFTLETQQGTVMPGLEFGEAVIIPDDSSSAVFDDSGTYVLGLNVRVGGGSTRTLGGVAYLAGPYNVTTDVQTLTTNSVTVTVDAHASGQDRTDIADVLDLYPGDDSVNQVKHVLNTGVMSDASNGIDISFTGLTVGTTYRMQTLHLGVNGGEGSRDMVLTDGVDTSSSFSHIYTDGVISDAVSMTVVFTAEATTKTFNLDEAAGGDRSYINGLSLYAIGFKSTYDLWISDYPGVGVSAIKTDDPDNDSLSNLAEWALGGNPADAGDIGHVPVFEPLNDDGSYFQYVHAQRSDADVLGLSYALKSGESLIDASWTGDGVEIIGTNVTGEAFDYVTNRVSADAASAQFLNLIIESN
jgi:hypothetical protein